jgi:DNA ligase-1
MKGYNMKNDFEALQSYVDEMKSTSSANNKKVILQKHRNDFIMKVLYYVNSPYITFGVKSSALVKFTESYKNKNTGSLFDLLDSLASRELTGHDALTMINTFVNNNPNHKQLIYNIIDRDIETRANTNLINKVVPGWIPEFKVALANSYKEKYVDFKKDEWFASRKLDGVRALCRIGEDGKAEFYSRTGKVYTTLKLIKSEIYQLDPNLKGLVLDGEICIEKDGIEDFQGVLKEVRKKDHTMKNPRFFIFDCLTLEEFDSGTSTVKLEDRLKRVPKIKHCTILTQYIVKSHKEIEDMAEEAAEKGWEGIMIRKNDAYKGKRSNDLLKKKYFKDSEYVVLETINDNMRFFENGQDVERETLSAVVIKHNKHKVKVGSGFSKEQREKYYNNPSEIIGKVITVQYFEESKNEKGEVSLRFPTLKAIHGDERTT